MRSLVLAAALLGGAGRIVLEAQSPQSSDVAVRPYKGKPAVFVDQKPFPLEGFNTFGKAAFDRSMTLSYGQKFSIYFLRADVANF